MIKNKKLKNKVFTTSKTRMINTIETVDSFIPKKDNEIYIALNGILISLDKETLNEIWSLSYKKILNSPASILYDQARLYIGQTGRVICVDVNSRSVVWKNKLKSLKFGCVSLVTNETSVFLGINGHLVSLRKVIFFLLLLYLFIF